MFIRFVAPQLNARSNVRQGLFQVAAKLRDSRGITALESEELADAIDWFNENLERPGALRRSRRPHAVNKAISWFKPTASEHIRRMYQMVEILQRHEVAVEVIKSDRVGYVVYEDEYQIVAEPFRETGA